MEDHWGYRVERCVECGRCLSECPVLELPEETAKQERKRLNSGAADGPVLESCTSCLACNVICPEGCDPAYQILDRWHEQYQAGGLPAYAHYYDPNAYPNFRTYVVERLPADEKALVDAWSDTSPCEEILFPGCNIITVPYLLRTRLVEGLTIRGALGTCCGEMYYRSGLLEPLRAVAQKLEAYFGAMKVKKVVIPCTAGMNMLTNVLPRHGASFDFEVEHLLARVMRQFESGDLQIEKPLDMAVTIQESCHAKIFGEEFLDLPRKLLELLGVTVIEQSHCREKALCCGIGGGFSISSGYHPVPVTRATLSSLAEARKTGAQAIVTYCAGCLQMLSVGQLVPPFNRMPVYHLLELLAMAIGETPLRRHRARARLMLAGVTRHQVPALLSRKRTRVAVNRVGGRARGHSNKGG